MPQKLPEGYTAVTPYLYYKDSDAALEFITSVLGAKEKFKMAGEDGKIAHAEVEFDGGVVMLGTPSPDYKSPSELGGRTAGIYVYIDDVDRHFERIKEAGAKITEEPTDKFYGDRSYGCEDPEGHQWWFATHVKEVPMEEMQAAMASSTN
jgi:PhnB protein